MNCVNHKERAGINTCSKCGEWLCSECSLDVNSQIVCKSCASPSAYRVSKSCDYGRTPRYRDVNGFLLLIISLMLPPGTNFMYMGLMKRGLFYLSSFFLSIYMITVFSRSAVPFAFLIVIIYITSFFDGFRVRRQFIAGEIPEDSVNDIKSFFMRHKIAVLVVLTLLMLKGVLSTLSYYAYMFTRRGHFTVAKDVFLLAFTIVLIALGLHFLFGTKKSRKHSHDHDNWDDQDHK